MTRNTPRNTRNTPRTPSGYSHNYGVLRSEPTLRSQGDNTRNTPSASCRMRRKFWIVVLPLVLFAFLDSEAGDHVPQQMQIIEPVPQVAPGAGDLIDDGMESLEQNPKLDVKTFAAKDGRKGWKVTLERSLPLPTPAVVDDRVYVGGGFGSYEFYAFDARTGQPLWLFHCADDGPTAAVVSKGYV
ncbi:MAG: hypothetical protein U9Q76_10990, partial [candidate division WOR-3 bacterium]|nr:hypothetical protein [candidate division WOR-3 bacterium]